MAHAFNPSTWKTEGGDFLSSRPARSRVSSRIVRVVHRETQSQKANTNKQTKVLGSFKGSCAFIFRILGFLLSSSLSLSPSVFLFIHFFFFFGLF